MNWKKLSLCVLSFGATLALYAAPQRINVVATLPFEVTPTQDDFNYFTTVDANGDGKTWKYQSTFKGFVSPSNDNLDADDWLIFPGINFDASKTYELSFQLAANMKGPLFRSAFEVYVGPDQDPANMQKYGGRIDFYSSTGSLDKPEGPFTVQFGIQGESGVRYVAVRCITPKLEKVDNPASYKGYDEYSSWPASMRNISVKATEVSAQTPKTPEIAVTPAEQGELKAHVTFTMPTESMAGETLRPADKLKAVIASGVEEITVEQLPGTSVDAWVKTAQGLNTVSVRVDSDEQGSPVSKEVYTGVYKPNRVHDLTATLSPDNLEMTMTWTPPTTAKDNGYFDPAKVTYAAYTREGEEFVKVGDAGSALTYTYKVKATDPQAGHTVYIIPSNAAGMSDDTTAWTYEDPVYCTAVLGTPYALPLREDFEGLQVKYTPMRNEKPTGYYGRIILDDPSGWLASEDKAAMLAYNPLSEGDTKARAATPKISTKGVHNAALSFSALSMSGTTAPISVYAVRHGAEPVLIATVNEASIGSAQWKEYIYPLPAEFQDKDWVQFFFDFDLPDVDYVGLIDWYSLAHTADNDLALTSASATSGFPIGEQGSINAEVHNLGMNAATPTVRLDVTADGTNVFTATKTATNSVESGQYARFSFPFTAQADMYGKEVVATLTITDGDEVPANDSKTITLDVRRAEVPVVLDLKAENATDHVVLTWSRPMLSPYTTQGFEQAESWTYADDIEGFANVDVDGQSVYRFTNNTMPHENTPKAFMVALPAEMQDGTGFETYDGEKYLMVTCPEQLTDAQPAPADDWLISPLTEGGMHFSFQVQIITESYPETFEVLASSRGREPSDFSTLLGRFTKSRRGWEKMEYQLPEDARYFALRYVSRNMFGAFIDDIRFADAAKPLQVEKYAVYRNGQLLDYTTDERFEDHDVNSGEQHTYQVQTIADGTHPLGNSFTILYEPSGLSTLQAPAIRGVKGALQVSGMQGRTLTVSNLAGQTVWNAEIPSASFTLPLPAGIYLTPCGKHIVK